MMSLIRNGNAGLWMIVLLIILGIVIGVWQPIELDELIEMGRQAADYPALIVAVLVIMVLMFSFGLPGSFGLWLIAPFHPPMLATALLLSSSVVGALGAYAFSARMGKDWTPSGMTAKVMKLLENQGGVMTQIAMRVLPGFPHSVVNFAGGVLKLPLPGFMIAALIGQGAKWAVYATAVYGVVDAVESGDAIQPITIVPLIVLSVLLLSGAWFKRKFMANGE